MQAQQGNKLVFSVLLSQLSVLAVSATCPKTLLTLFLVPQLQVTKPDCKVKMFQEPVYLLAHDAMEY